MLDEAQSGQNWHHSGLNGPVSICWNVERNGRNISQVLRRRIQNVLKCSRTFNLYAMLESSHRSHFRNVHFFDEVNPDVVPGGLIQNGSLTEKNFHTGGLSR